MLSRTHTGTFGTCGTRTTPGKAYRATPLGSGLGSHPPTLKLPRRTVSDHCLPKVPLNDGLSDDLACCTYRQKRFFSRLGFTARDITILLSVSSGALI